MKEAIQWAWELRAKLNHALAMADGPIYVAHADSEVEHYGFLYVNQREKVRKLKGKV